MADILAAFDELEKEDKKVQVKVHAANRPTNRPINHAAKPEKKKKLQSSFVSYVKYILLI